jgi:histidine decarboxylase
VTTLDERTVVATQTGADGDVATVEAVAGVLAELREHLVTDRATNIGFPSTFDFDYTPLWPFFNHLMNNVGDPYLPSAFPANTKHLEREVVDWFADLLHAPADDRWGYVTSGGSEGTEYGLLLARTLFPDAVTYFSDQSHYSVPKVLAKLRMPAVAISTDDEGRLDIDDLRDAIRQRREHPAIVLATIGTTMTEAIDDLAGIREVLNRLAIRRAWVHADAALSGLPLALLPREQRPPFDLADGADSISVSGHKFLGSPFPCGIVLTRRSSRDRIGSAIEYIGTRDTTIGGSRSGHAPLLLWYAIRTHGVDGLRRRAAEARRVAAHAERRLHDIDWYARRHPHALTVVLRTPPAEVAIRWRLATSGDLSHLICMPGITEQQIDAFVADLATSGLAKDLREWIS